MIYTNSKITVVLASNQNYLKLLVPCIVSILYNKKPTTKIDIFILDGGINEIDKQKIKELESFNGVNNCKIDFIDIKAQFNNLEVTPETLKNYSIASFYRLLIPQLFKHLKRVLYLDVDTIIRGDLLDFYNRDFENNYCIASKEVRIVKHNQLLDQMSSRLIEYNNKFYLYNNLLLKLGLSENTTDKQGVVFINSGVLLFNIPKILTDNKDKQLIDYAFNYAKILICPDQDIIRIVFEDKIKYCDRKYNYFIPLYDYFTRLSYKKQIIYKLYLKTATIYHYTGMKPYKFNRLYKIIPFACKEFFRYYQMSYLRINPIKLWVIFLFNHLNRLRRKIIGTKTEYGNKKVFYFWRLEFVIKMGKPDGTII